jgi:uncharacterized membrane protein
VNFDGWMLALHVVSAFSLVAGITLYWVIIVAVRQTDSPETTLRLGPLAMTAQAVTGIGAVGTIVLGLWLSFSVGGYDIWDGWIIAAIVLWVVSMGLGQRTGAAYARGVSKARELQTAGQTGPSAELLAVNRTSSGVVLHFLGSVVILLLLIDMIWKPGA